MVPIFLPSFELMNRCWKYGDDFEDRPSFSDIVRDLGKLIHNKESESLSNSDTSNRVGTYLPKPFYP